MNASIDRSVNRSIHYRGEKDVEIVNEFEFLEFSLHKLKQFLRHEGCIGLCLGEAGELNIIYSQLRLGLLVRFTNSLSVLMLII